MRARFFRHDPDLGRMHHLIADSWRARDALNTFHVGDLHWRLRPQRGRDPLRDIRLWEDGERLMGFAWYDSPDAGDVLTSPEVADREALEGQLLDWLEDRHIESGRARELSFVPGGCEGDPARIGLLQRRGYTRARLGYLHTLVELDGALATPELPDGFSLRAVTDPADVAERAAVHSRAWESNLLTREVYEAVRAGPLYRPEFDVVAVAPDGSFATSCLAWLDEQNQTALFEPVGCDPAYRRRGLTRAAMLFCMHQLARSGARRAAVVPTSDNAAALALYEACGFRVYSTDWDWERKLA